MRSDNDFDTESKLDSNICNSYIDVKKSILQPRTRRPSPSNVSITHGTESEEDEVIDEIVEKFH